LPDPYAIAEEEWSNNMSLWPDLHYGDVYNYSIELKGQYTGENLKTFKSLKAFSYFYNDHVRTVYCYPVGRFMIDHGSQGEPKPEKSR